MARMARNVVPAYRHHITQQGVCSLPIFRGDGNRWQKIGGRFFEERIWPRMEIQISADTFSGMRLGGEEQSG
jgi:hypothetical protein